VNPPLAPLAPDRHDAGTAPAPGRKKMDIKSLQWELAAFVVDRGLDPVHTPKNLSMALAAEAGTLLALFKWLEDGDAPSLGKPAERDAAAEALADSVLHAIHLADRLGIDLDEAIRRKLARNAEKYPPLPQEVPPPGAAPPAPAAAAPERRAVPDRRITSDRRVAPEQRQEPERRSGVDRRAGAERRSAAARGPAIAGPPTRSRVEPTPPPARPEPPPPPRSASAPPPVAPFEPPPPRPAPQPAARHESRPPPQPEPPLVRHEPPPRPAPPPVARAEPPPPPPAPEPVREEVDPYASLDLDAARRLVDTLVRQVNRARSDDPLARELHDELTTLKRTLYADDPKRAWLASSLKSIGRILEEARSHSVGAELRAGEYLAEVERILKT
jgi:NTP pyrophosphatase (non-canonical NTP hydrolase)